MYRVEGFRVPGSLRHRVEGFRVNVMTIFAGYGLDFHKYLFYHLFIVSGIVPSIIGFIIFSSCGVLAIICSSFGGSQFGLRAWGQKVLV